MIVYCQNLDKEQKINVRVKYLCADHTGSFQFLLKPKSWKSRELLFIDMAYGPGDKAGFD